MKWLRKKRVVKYKKNKGVQWERDAAKLLMEMIPGSKFKRVAGSGAIGTIMEEPLLAGDIVGMIPGLPKELRGEAKVGYGGSKQMAFRREWLEKIREEAAGTYSIPLVLGKFSGARGDSKHFVALDFKAFAEIARLIKELYESEVAALEELHSLKNG
jgi:hypothetical protein